MRGLIIIPTRARNDKHFEVYKAIKATSSQVDILFGLDDDDEQNYIRIDDPIVKYDVNPRMRMLPTLNLLATKYAEQYDFIGFMGDDHRPRSAGWDTTFIDHIDSNSGWGICYGNDLIQGENMCTAVFMSSNIIKTLGYMHPKNLIHLVADIFWRELGLELGILKYFPDTIIEHMHYTVGKADKDAMYEEVNSGAMYSADGAAYGAYKTNEWAFAVDKLHRAIFDSKQK